MASDERRPLDRSTSFLVNQLERLQDTVVQRAFRPRSLQHLAQTSDVSAARGTTASVDGADYSHHSR
jgi:hypothetical protein